MRINMKKILSLLLTLLVLSSCSDSLNEDGGSAGLAPTSSAHDAQDADNARKKHGFPAGVQKCAKVCKHPEKGKSNEKSYDSSLDFCVLEGTRIPGPLIKRAPQSGYSDF